MSPKLFAPLVGCLLICPALLFAQSDSTRPQKPVTKKTPNTTHLELIYRDDAKVGSISAHARPWISINGAKPLKIDKQGLVLSRYYNRCPQSRDFINKMNKNRKHAKIASIGLGIAGGLIAVSSPYIHHRHTGKMLTQIGAGSVVIGTGVIIGAIHQKRALKNMVASVEAYNSFCYQPIPGQPVKSWQDKKTATDSTSAQR
ncbi:hypothetical protein MKQ68_08170 [Chitinophaga horti]|uniref:Uncharacterized protein n=1 Tax=Chitinophaga horti TaxID=2920382 RepID=A0ABY6J9T6_9BACT|nr:hypothetical protein [Chitinophaga horti]UYQ95069.1 hypothetical protein MKQ68_08170 [Chitinophaga horti]